MKENLLKKKLNAGQYVIGTFAKFSDPASAEILALAGFDFFVLDNEHVVFNPENIVHILRAADSCGITPILRVRKNADVEILQALDIGAAGVLVPQVNSLAEAQKCVSYVKYAPLGNRGFAPTHRAAEYGTLNPAEYAAYANQQTFLGCYCETRQAVEEVDQIAAVDGIDVLFIGPMDLSSSYGVIGKPQTPIVQSAIDHVISTCHQHHRAVGTIASNAAEARMLIQRGLRFVTISSDQGLMLNKAREELSLLREMEK